MKFIKFNNNPKNNITKDCVIRAISFATNKSWEDIYREKTFIYRTRREISRKLTLPTLSCRTYDTLHFSCLSYPYILLCYNSPSKIHIFSPL